MEKILKKHPKLQKSIIYLIIFTLLTPAIFLSFKPKTTSAQPGIGVPIQNFIIEGSTASTNIATWKDWVLIVIKEGLMMTARKMINKISQDTINWINSGYHGNPFFLENPESFFKDIVKFEVKNLVDIYAYNKAKFPFGKQFALDTITSYQKKMEDNAAYTLSNIIKDEVYLESYRNNFNVGGWDGFFINTQYPQNNYIGFQMLAHEELARKLDGTTTNAAKTVQDTLQKSQGFLAPKLCLDTLPNGKPTGYNNGKNEFLQPKFDPAKYNKDNPNNCPDLATMEERVACTKQWTAEFEKAKATFNETNGCKNLAVTTPGGVVGNQIKEALASKFDQAELAAAVGNGFAGVFDALLNDLANRLGKGLKGLYNRPPEAVAGVPAQANNGGIPPELSVPPGGGGTCTGGNTKCICVEGIASYKVYEDAVTTAENTAYPGMSGPAAAGVTPVESQAGVCTAYAGPGTCSPSKQEDELVISGLPAPYVTLSIDFLVGGNPSYTFGARAVASCEAGVQ